MNTKTLRQLLNIQLLALFLSELILPVIITLLMTDISSNSASYLMHVANNFSFQRNFHLLLFPIFILIAPIFGYLSDYHSKRTMLIVCHTLLAAGYLIALLGSITHGSSFFLLTIMIVRLGLCSEPITLSTFVLTRDSHKTIFLFGSFFILSIVVVLFSRYANYLTQALQVNSTVLFFGGSVAEILLLLKIIFQKNIQVELQQHQKMTKLSFSRSLHSVLTSQNFLIFLALFLLFTYSVATYYQNIDLYLKSLHHYSLGETTTLQYLMLMMKIIGLTTVFMIFIKKYTIYNLMIFILIASTLGISLLLNMSLYHYAWILSAVVVAALTSGIKLIWLMVTKNSTVPLTGLTQGLITATWVAANILSNITSVIFTLVNPIYPVLLSFFGIGVATAIIISNRVKYSEKNDTLENFA